MFISQIIGRNSEAANLQDVNFSFWNEPYESYSEGNREKHTTKPESGGNFFKLNEVEKTNLLVLLSVPVRVYLHELGHLLANSLFYTNATSLISLQGLGFYGGFCKTTFKGNPIYSTLGKSLENFSKGTTSTAISAAGPLVDMVCLLGLSRFSKKSKAISLSQSMASHFLVAYALSALVADKSDCNGHDFCNIWARSGTLAYGAITAACVATHVYVHRHLFETPIVNRSLGIGRWGWRPVSIRFR